jgi:hypothetical protein
MVVVVVVIDVAAADPPSVVASVMLNVAVAVVRWIASRRSVCVVTEKFSSYDDSA